MKGAISMKKIIAIIMSALILAGTSATVNTSVGAKTSITANCTKNKGKANTGQNITKVRQVSKAIKSAKAYGKKLGMHYDKSLNRNNSSWFSPTNAKYYKTTKELTKALKDDVKYVAYFYKDSGIRPSDISFNIIKVGTRIYVCYC